MTKRTITVKALAWKGYLIGFVAVLMAAHAPAATTVADSWSSTEADAGVSVAYNGGSVTAQFPSAFGERSSVLLVPGTTQPGAGFAGDYRRAGISTASLTVSSVGPLGLSFLQLTSGENRWVRGNLAAGANVIGLNRKTDGWTLLYATADEATLDALWQQDLRSVGSLVVCAYSSLAATGTSSLTISRFQLDGTSTVGSALSLADALEAEFGVRNVADVDPALGNGDKDHDGMSNLDEILVEYDAAYWQASKLFKADVSVGASGAVEIKFAVVKRHTYQILRADSVSGTYEQVGTFDATDTGVNGTFTDSNPGTGANFYKIVEQ